MRCLSLCITICFLIACTKQESIVSRGKGVVVHYQEEEGKPHNYGVLENLTPLQDVEVVRKYNTYSVPTTCCAASDASVTGSVTDGTTFTDQDGNFLFENTEHEAYYYIPLQKSSGLSSLLLHDKLYYVFDKSKIYFSFVSSDASVEVERDSMDYYLRHPVVGELYDDMHRTIYQKSEKRYYLSTMANLNLELHYRYGTQAEYRVQPIYTSEGEGELIEVFID